MDINQYSIFEKDTIELAKSILIHSKEIAECINDGLKEKGQIVEDDPKTWKYYMNLNGEYHYTDPEPFIIISKDTLEPISFTKENLADHPATAVAYKLGNFEYKRLVSRHPEAEMLIRGIVSPVGFENSIESDNYKILDWDESLIDENEFSLIEDIQSYVNAYFLNHHNLAYSVTDNLYLTANLAILYIFLPKVILNARIKRCLTNEAHSFHIWAYLSSYGRLDRWKNVLDLYQKHYLYRNIRSINDNAGETLIFNDLTKVLLSRNAFPLYGYDLRHIIKYMPEQITPEILATRYRIDEEVNVTNFSETKEVKDLITDTVNCARDNIDVKNEAIDKTVKKMIKSSKDRVVTKVLESEVVNKIENIALQVRELAYNHWVYLSCEGLYPVGVEIDYRPANINIQISSLEALALYVYCGSLVLGYKLETIPDIHCFKIKKSTLPEKNDLLKIKFSKDISYKWIDNLISRQVKINEIDSVLDFNNLCHSLRENDFTDRFSNSLFESLNGNTNAKMLTKAFWANKKCNILNENYLSFFARLSIDHNSITEDNAKEIMDLIFFKVTGFDPNDLGTSFILKSLIELLTYLSSYNIQVIENDKFSRTLPVNWPLLRLNIFGIFLSSIPVKVKLPLSIALKSKGSIKNVDIFNLYTLEKIQSLVSIYSSYKINCTVDLTQRSYVSYKEKVKIPLIRVI